jgi:hypothetical protein
MAEKLGFDPATQKAGKPGASTHNEEFGSDRERSSKPVAMIDSSLGTPIFFMREIREVDRAASKNYRQAGPNVRQITATSGSVKLTGLLL